jgi:hypothetical protein
VALAEIEVIARATADVEPSVFFTRGDIDCDSRVNITDAVSLLNTLFLNGPALCCGSAADTNVDSRIDLTDAVVLADHAFRGADPLAAPFPGCGRASEGRFVCEQETCP